MCRPCPSCGGVVEDCDSIVCSRCLCDVLDDNIPTPSELYAKENKQVKERNKIDK